VFGEKWQEETEETCNHIYSLLQSLSYNSFGSQEDTRAVRVATTSSILLNVLLGHVKVHIAEDHWEDYLEVIFNKMLEQIAEEKEEIQ
jgi:hypothetical protein